MDDALDQIVDCPDREACGACSLLLVPYREQLERKRVALEKALSGRLRLKRGALLDTMPSPRIVGYRNRAKMTISSDREHRWHLGYFQRKSREVVDAPDCGVLVPELLETTRSIRRLMNETECFPFSLRHVDLRCGSDPKKQHLTLVVKAERLPELPIDQIAEACPRVAGIAVNLNSTGNAQVIKGRIDPVHGVREVFVESAGLSLRVSPGSFFQVNLGMLPLIHARMEEFLGRGELLLDLYAGVGTHALALRERFGKVLCVEGVRGAVADAKASIKAGRVGNVEVISSPLSRAVRRLRSETPDAIILNPSAAGADRSTLEMIAGSKARSLAYLSCDPNTLARDLSALVDGGYTLVNVQAVDMMPQTNQIESLALLQR